MKKFLLSVALFGAFLSVSTALVSCGDDYNDSGLTEQIAANKTAMETRLAALEAAQAALPSLATIQAQIATEVATAKEAALAAATTADAAQLVIVNASIDALKTELTDLIASNKAATDAKLVEIDTQLAEIAGRLTTLEGLVSTNTANVASVTAALTALTNRVSVLEGTVAQNVTEIAINKSLIEAQVTALDAYKVLINGQLADVVADIDGINTSIAAIAARLDANESAIEALNDLGINLTAAFRSLLSNIELTSNNWWLHILSYYAETIVDDDAFGPAGEVVLPAIGEINASFVADSLLFVANPSTVDWSGLELSLENSTRDELANVSITTPVASTDIKTRAASVGGVLKSTISFDSPVISQDWIDATRHNGMHTSYLLTVTDPNATDGRKIQSRDDVVLDHRNINVNLGLTVACNTPVAIYDAGTAPIVGQIANPVLSSTNYVWKKYITVSDASVSNGDIDGVDMVVEGDQLITLSTADASLANKTVTFVYHYLYMDGQRGEESFDVVFTKLQYDETQLVLASTIDFDLAAADQLATSATVLADLQANIADVDAWLADVAHVTVAPITNETDVLPFVGTVIAKYADNSTASLTADAIVPIMYPYTPSAEDFVTMELGYDATVITAEGRYGSTLTFYNSLGNVINVVKVYADVTGPLSSLFTDAISKVTNTWNTELNVNNVWAQLSNDSQDAIYNVNSSYNGSLADVKFASTEAPVGFVAFDATNGSIFTVHTPSSIAAHNDGLYPAQSMFSPFAGFVWAVTDNFDYKVLSPVKESAPAWRAGYDNEFTYTAGGNISISHDDIMAIDPSVASAQMYFVGNTPATRAAYVAATDKDWRIASVEFTVADPSATPGSSNVGLVELKDAANTVVETVVDPVSFSIHAKPQGGSYAVNPSDYTLNLVMTVTDVFGFTKVTTFDFIVDNGQ